MHDFGGGGHVHEEAADGGVLYDLDNVVLETIGIDVGSSTFHLTFARVHLCRDTTALSSRFEVVEREVLWSSEIGLTPYRGGRIDADAVAAFVAAGYEKAGVDPSEIDSGAVILTGEALRQKNARALGEAIAAGSGKFVCVSAGHHLESLLAAHGSGATAYSRASGARLLHIDIGGGTTKLSLIDNGQVSATAAVMVGGRQVAWNHEREILSTTAGARALARAAGVELVLGATFSRADEERFVAAQCAAIVALATDRRDPLGRRLRLTAVLPPRGDLDAVSFSGGVSEYIYGREHAEYGDLGAALGRKLRAALDSGQIPLRLVDPGEGIRATVIGASQCSVQLSGNTVTVSHPQLLPVHNIPVVHPELPSRGASGVDPAVLAGAIRQAIARHGLVPGEAVALAFSWQGDPSYPQLASFCSGLQGALGEPSGAPVLVLLDDDLARSVGRLLLGEFALSRPLICLDGLELAPLDYVDVGAVLEPSGALPVVIKSLLFGPTH